VGVWAHRLNARHGRVRFGWEDGVMRAMKEAIRLPEYE
jgi:hypothetical protein